MTGRRPGSDATRTAIIDAAEALMVESGYASVTSRGVAAKAGLKSNLLHYHFKTMDELFVALYRRVAETFAREREEALASDRPLQRLWDLTSDPKAVTIIFEFVALANHRKAVQAELAAFGTRFRQLDVEIAAKVLARKGLGWAPGLPTVLAVIVESVSRSLSMQSAIGVTKGRDETIAMFQRVIEWLDS